LPRPGAQAGPRIGERPSAPADEAPPGAGTADGDGAAGDPVGDAAAAVPLGDATDGIASGDARTELDAAAVPLGDAATELEADGAARDAEAVPVADAVTAADGDDELDGVDAAEGSIGGAGVPVRERRTFDGSWLLFPATSSSLGAGWEPPPGLRGAAGCVATSTRRAS
jgi:hypothetical protein